MIPVFDTMDAFLGHWAKETPTAEAAIDGERRLDFATLEAQVSGLARWMAQEGVTAGMRVGVASSPSIACYISLLAISRIGAIYVGISPRYTVSEIVHVISLTEPDLIIIDTKNDQELVTRIQKAASNVRILAVDTPASLPQQVGPQIQAGSKAEDVAVIVFTSGSTGKPKGAALHHGGLIAAARAQAMLSDVWPDGAQARYLSNLPMNHVGGIMNLTLASLVNGGALVFQSKFDPGETLALLKAERITTWLQVPAMFTLCVQTHEFPSIELQDLRTIGIGGGPVSQKTLTALRSLGADIFVEYGQTETMSSLTASAKDDPDEVLLNTVGTFDPAFEARIAKRDGAPVTPGDVGEVQARGNCTLRSYWGNPQSTHEVFTEDGWLRTGDLAMQRPDGRIVLVGRAREMIKSGGFNVYPREVEQVLETHKAIAEVVVFGVQDDVYVERVEAAIELREGAEIPDPETLTELCREILAGYKIPRRYYMGKSLPRLPNGKVDRAALKAAYQ